MTINVKNAVRKDGTVMKRECLRCGAEMIMGLGLEMRNVQYFNTILPSPNPWGFQVTKGGHYDAVEVRLKAAVCPECGYTEPYVDEPEKLKP